MTDRASVIARAEKAAKWLRVQLPGPCCGGPAIHLNGAEAIRDLLALLRDQEAQMARLEQEMRKGIEDAVVEGYQFGVSSRQIAVWADQLAALRSR